VFYLTYEVVLKPSNPEFRSVAGGYFSLWLNQPTVELADEAARAALEADGYDVVSREECREVTRGEYANNPRGLALFDEAATHGVSISCTRWPV
jgi:hypothetical protein